MRSVAMLSLLAAFGLRAFGQTHTSFVPVSVVLDFERAEHTVSLPMLQTELQNLLADSRLTIDLRSREELPQNPQLGEVVIFKMRGHCTGDPLPVGALSDERGTLAMTYTSDGQILPFGEVECDKVRQSLERVLGKSDDDRHRKAFGVAVARVMAHEIYHMLGDSRGHTKTGITKESLSPAQLSEIKMSVPAEAQEKLKHSLHYSSK